MSDTSKTIHINTKDPDRWFKIENVITHPHIDGKFIWISTTTGFVLVNSDEIISIEMVKG